MENLEQKINETIRAFQSNKLSKNDFFDISNNYCFEIFFDEKENVNIINKIANTLSSSTPLDLQFFEFYLKKGISANYEDCRHKRTPVFQAKKNIEIVKILHNYGANINHIDKMGSTFILYETTFDVVKYVFDNNINIFTENEEGINILYSLFNQNYNYGDVPLNERKRILLFLLDQKIFNLNDYNSKKQTLLQFALMRSDLGIEELKILLKYGANPDMETIVEYPFRLWSKETTVLPKGLKFIDLLTAEKKTLVEEYNKGLIHDKYYFDKGLNYYNAAIELINKKKKRFWIF